MTPLARRRCALSGLCLVLCAVARPGVARAEDNAFLVQARADIDAVEFDKARESLERALLAGSNGPTQLAEIYRLSGEVAVAVGDADGAEQAFQRLLAIAPDSKLRDGVSPKIKSAFDAAAAALGDKRLRIDYVTGPGTITLVVDADPLDLVAGAAIDYVDAVGGRRTQVKKGKFRIEVSLDEAAPVPHKVALAALDAHGNRLAELGSLREPLAVPAVATAPRKGAGKRHRASRSFLGKGWLWAGLAVASAGAGTYFALQVKQDEDDLETLNKDSMNHSFSEARAIQDRAEDHALYTNISFGVAGGFAILATVLFLRGDPRAEAGDGDGDASAEAGRSARLVPSPTRGGASLDLVLTY
ncbi:MAG: hypothetical protein IT370_07340 [Deltaproteobacteria bacterium]|nr:hypothetical protein [Deltaproteobacteria bacterium]